MAIRNGALVRVQLMLHRRLQLADLSSTSAARLWPCDRESVLQVTNMQDGAYLLHADTGWRVTCVC